MGLLAIYPTMNQREFGSGVFLGGCFTRRLGLASAFAEYTGLFSKNDCEAEDLCWQEHY